MNEIEFVKEQLEKGNYTMLDESIAIGTVYKIHSVGNLAEEGFEIGYLYIPKGCGIKSHPHYDNLERYLLIYGDLTVGGQKKDYDICTLNNSHNIDPVSEDTIIQTCKINKYNLSYLYNIDNGAFDNLVNKAKVYKKVL